MTPAHKAMLFSPPIAVLVLALGWAVVDRLLRPLGKPTGWFDAR